VRNGIGHDRRSSASQLGTDVRIYRRGPVCGACGSQHPVPRSPTEHHRFHLLSRHGGAERWHGHQLAELTKGSTLNKKIIAAGALALLTVSLLAGCTQADTVNQNLSQDAENFQIERKIIAINGITDKVIMEVTGRCSVDTGDSSLAGSFEITCKIAEDAYKKNFVYLSDNVTVTVEQLDPVDSSVYHYQWYIAPEALVPEIVTSTGKQ